jgi:hypothetical protein
MLDKFYLLFIKMQGVLTKQPFIYKGRAYLLTSYVQTKSTSLMAHKHNAFINKDSSVSSKVYFLLIKVAWSLPSSHTFIKDNDLLIYFVSPLSTSLSNP